MKDLLRTSKFWKVVGLVLSLAGAGVAYVAAQYGDKEMKDSIIADLSEKNETEA